MPKSLFKWRKIDLMDRNFFCLTIFSYFAINNLKIVLKGQSVSWLTLWTPEFYLVLFWKPKSNKPWKSRTNNTFHPAISEAAWTYFIDSQYEAFRDDLHGIPCWETGKKKHLSKNFQMLMFLNSRYGTQVFAIFFVLLCITHYSQIYTKKITHECEPIREAEEKEFLIWIYYWKVWSLMIYQGIVFKGTNMENSFLFLLIRCDDVVPRMASNLKGILQGGHFKEQWWRVCRDGQRNLLAFSVLVALEHSLTEFNLSLHASSMSFH